MEVHVLGNRRNLPEASHREMLTSAHSAHDVREPVELQSLGGSQWIPLEKRHDAGSQILKGPDRPPIHVESMVIASAIDTDTPTVEVLLQLMQNERTRRRLHHDEVRLALPAEPRRALPKDRHGETALAVHEPDDPLLDPWPFLLIVRTGTLSPPFR